MKSTDTRGGYPAGRTIADGPMPVPFPTRPTAANVSGPLDLHLTDSDRVAINVTRHLRYRRWDLDHLDTVMADLGWGGAFWHATPAARTVVDVNPVTALRQLLDGERPLVTDEDYALATALNVPVDHLRTLPTTPPPRRRSRWARLFGRR